MTNKKKILIIIIPILLILIIIGSTFAWVSWNSSTNTDVSIDIDDCTVVQYNGGDDITSSSIIPTLTKEEGIIKEITIKQKNTCDVSSSVNLYLQINNMGTGLNYQYFKWELYKNGSALTNGNFSGKATGNTITLTTNQAVTTTQDTYKLYLWIDGNVDNPASIDNQAFDFSVYATGSGRLHETGAEKLINLYNSKTATPVTTTGGESITQVSELGMMQDSFGNYRYYGLNPNNYVNFNGEEEGWRIIGIFNVENDKGKVEKRIKLIRSSSIGNYPYDNKTNGIGSSSSDNGSNNWSDSRLMIMLNSEEETFALRESDAAIYQYLPGLFWSSGSGSCYSKTNGCDFTSIGLTSVAYDMIGKVKYGVSGYSASTGLYADDWYKYETTSSGLVWDDNDREWVGSVGLVSASDYAYASDLSICKQPGINYHTDTTNCTGTNWIYKLKESGYMWTMTPNSHTATRVFRVGSTGSVNYNDAAQSYAVIPVVFLLPTAEIVDGSGAPGDPYILG